MHCPAHEAAFLAITILGSVSSFRISFANSSEKKSITVGIPFSIALRYVTRRVDTNNFEISINKLFEKRAVITRNLITVDSAPVDLLTT